MRSPAVDLAMAACGGSSPFLRAGKTESPMRTPAAPRWVMRVFDRLRHQIGVRYLGV